MRGNLPNDIKRLFGELQFFEKRSKAGDSMWLPCMVVGPNWIPCATMNDICINFYKNVSTSSYLYILQYA